MLLNAYFERKEIAAGARFTVKSAVTLAIIALAVALPQIVQEPLVPQRGGQRAAQAEDENGVKHNVGQRANGLNEHAVKRAPGGLKQFFVGHLPK